VAAVKEILHGFGLASGLIINSEKCVAFPIRCGELDIQDMLQDFNCPLGSLTCKYLGLPLSLRKPRRVEVHPLIDKLVSKAKGWMGRLMAKPGRLILINSVLSSFSTYFLTMFAANPWAVKKMDKIRRNFLWDIEEGANGGGKCVVSWKRICSPKMLAASALKILLLLGEPCGSDGFGTNGVTMTGHGEAPRCRATWWISNFSQLAPRLSLAMAKSVSSGLTVGLMGWLLNTLRPFFSPWLEGRT
jgi:hypothetical protein